jgi:hypothetical protein
MKTVLSFVFAVLFTTAVFAGNCQQQNLQRIVNGDYYVQQQNLQVVAPHRQLVVVQDSYVVQQNVQRVQKVQKIQKVVVQQQTLAQRLAQALRGNGRNVQVNRSFQRSVQR